MYWSDDFRSVARMNPEFETNFCPSFNSAGYNQLLFLMALVYLLSSQFLKMYDVDSFLASARVSNNHFHLTF